MNLRPEARVPRNGEFGSQPLHWSYVKDLAMNSSHFSDTRLIDFPHANPLVTKLLDRYGFQLDESPSATAVVKLRIGLPQGSILLWDRATSLPRGPQRRHLLRSVSLTFQNALRCWLPYLWLSNPAHWDDPYLLWPMLIYASSRTFKPLSRQNYAFDLLNETTMPSILRSSLPTLKDWVPLFQAIHQNRPGPRREFQPQRFVNVIEQCDFDPHHLKRLLAHEQKLIAAFMDLADSHAEEPGSERFGIVMHRHLTRIYTSTDFSFLAPLLYIEVENTLAGHLLGQPILEAQASLSPAAPHLRPFPLPRPAYQYLHGRVSSPKQPNPAPSVHLS